MAIDGKDADSAAAPSAAPEGGIVEPVDLAQSPSDREALALIPEAYAASHNLVPLSVAAAGRRDLAYFHIEFCEVPRVRFCSGGL